MDMPATVQDAARGLRAHLGLSQQAMATKLSLSMGALRNYESGAVPNPEARPLYSYLICAELEKCPQFASVFRAALYKVLGVPDNLGGLGAIEPLDDFEKLLIAAMLAALRGEGGFERFRMPVFEALEQPAKRLSEKLGLQRVWRILSAKTVKEWASSPQRHGAAGSPKEDQ
jgi:transcriptional regulator with XRE-family HTH domain